MIKSFEIVSRIKTDNPEEERLWWLYLEAIKAARELHFLAEAKLRDAGHILRQFDSIVSAKNPEERR